jgi:murein DD-endopeptidase MepM/ murein hydrolase activator NlpD
MLRARICLIGLYLAASAYYLRAELLVLETPLGTRVEFSSSALAPGDIVAVRIVAAPGVRRAVVHLGTQSLQLGTTLRGLPSIGLIGLDLDVTSGSTRLSLIVLHDGGEVEEVERLVEIAGREFPVKKLWVEEKYVIPPPEVAERIRWETELLKTIYGIMTPHRLTEGGFTRPLGGEVTADYGEKRVYNNLPRSRHAGVDISAPFGSAVGASNSGRIVLARNLYFSGETVIIDHGLGLFTFYGHFSKLLVKRGDIVKEGDIIGLVGSTGRSTGPHLHWGARVGENRVNPLALMNLAL